MSGFYVHIQYVEYGPTVTDATAFDRKRRCNFCIISDQQSKATIGTDISDKYVTK